MAGELFRVSEAGAAGVVELLLPETMDVSEFDRLNESLLGLFNGRTSERWVIDAGGVSYMGSAVLGLLVNIRQQIVKDQGRIVLCNLSPRLTEVFFATSLQRLFVITRSRDEAVRAAGKR